MPCRYALLMLALPGFLAVSSSVEAQTYSHYYEVPGNVFVHDLTFHDGYLWASDRSSATGPRIIKVDPDNGQFVESIEVNLDVSIMGLTWDGSHFWVTRSFSSSNPRIYRIDPETGNSFSDIPAPSPLSNGLAWNDGDLWVSRANPNDEAAQVRIDPATGDELQAIPAPWTQPAGIAFIGDGTYWATNAGDDGTNIEKLYQVDLATGDMLQEIDMPDGIGRPRGLAYDGAGTMYMIAQTRPGATNYRIYVIDMGTVGNPTISLGASSIDFGTVITGNIGNQSLTISNTGDATLSISNVEITGDTEFDTDFAGTDVPADGQITVDLSFEPTEYGPHSATLQFNTNDVANPTVQIPLSGFALFPDRTAGLTADEHDFGAVRIDEPYAPDDGRAVRTFELGLVNQGAEDLSVSAVEMSGPFHVEQELELPLEIAPADTFIVLIGFRPVEVGPAEGEAEVHSNDATNPVIAVSLHGTGVNPEMDGGDPLWTLTIPDNPVTSFQDRKITAIGSMGDATGDGTADLAVVTRNYWVLGVRGDSWQTGEILWSFNTCPSNFNCGSVSGVDGLYSTGMVTGIDLDGDGHGDVIVGTGGGNNHVYALSGRDGSVIWAHGDPDDPYLGSYYAVDARLDFDGDGVPDVVAGTGTAGNSSPNPHNQRRVFLLSGATGEVIWQRQPNPFTPNFIVGQYVGSDGEPRAVAGGNNPEVSQRHFTAYDATGNLLWNHTLPFTPFLVAAVSRPDGEGEDVIVTGGSGSAALTKVDGDSGSQVWTVPGMSTVWSIDVVGDVTDSGVESVVVGDFSGNVTVYDGLDGSFVWNAAMPAQAFGVSTIGDIDQDGLPEVAVALANGQVRLLSGATGETLWLYNAGNGTIQQAAETVAMLPDIDGNNAPEIAAGTRHGNLVLLKSTGELLPTAGEQDATPLAFELHAPYPNPTREGTVFGFVLPEAEHVRVVVYDLLGRRVATVLDGERPAGAHEVAWNGHSTSNGPLAAGMYLVRLEGERQVATQGVVIVR